MSGGAPVRADFLDFSFDIIERDDAARAVDALSRASSFTYVVTPNVDHVVQGHHMSEFDPAPIYRCASLCLCDSRILARLARLSGLRLPVVAGSDLTRDLLTSALSGGRVALVGGDAHIHQQVRALYQQFDWIFFIPPMGVRSSPAARHAIAEFVEQSEANAIFFAIGAPQSEMICHEILQRNRARGVALCVGASLEFLTGAKSRAPVWMQRSGFEWLYRLLSEPRRLWRRYLVEGPKIFRIWWRWNALNRSHGRASSGSSSSDGL